MVTCRGLHVTTDVKESNSLQSAAACATDESITAAPRGMIAIRF